MQMRTIVRRIHLWLGLGLGALFALLGLTGSALVFYVEIDKVLHPELHVTSEAAPGWDSLTWERAVATLRQAYPDKPGPWRLEVTGRSGPIPARYYNPPETAGKHFAPMLVWLSPDGSQVLRRSYWGDDAMTWIYNLHMELLAGKAGATVVGWSGVVLVVLLLSGLWAWWPRGSLAKALALKDRAPPVRKWRDWHKLAGLLSLPLLLILGATGAMLGLPDETRNALAGTLGAPHSMAMPHPPHSMEPQLPVSAVLAAGHRVTPQARLAWIEVPGLHGGTYRLRVQQPGDPSYCFPHGYVHLDARTGKVLAFEDPVAGNASDTVLAWLHPLHDGSAGGLAGRIIAALGGLFPAILFATGLLRWRARRRRVAR